MSTQTDDMTLRERIVTNPRPALLWLAGFALLVAVELGRFARGVLAFGDALWFLITGLAKGPGWVEGNVAGTLGSVAGSIAYLLAALLFLGLAAVVVKWLFVPISIVDRLGIERSAGQEELIERGLLALGLGVLAALIVWTPLGGVLDAVVTAIRGGVESVASMQTLTSRETIPNQGYQNPDGSGWEETFMGLSPAWAWAVRVLVIYAYAFLLLGWLWKGYDTFREHYREADWTPRDDSVNRFRTHYWGIFGLVVVFAFVVMAIWAPALGPVTAEGNLYSPYENEFQYTEDGEVKTVTHGAANINTRSQGGDSNVGPLSYDQYNRWAPLGTNQDGKDLFTYVAFGARTSLVIGITAIGLGTLIALVLSLVTAYYKGLIDLFTIIASDTIISIPAFLMVLLLSVVFQEANHPIAQIYDGGFLLALIFAGVYWPTLWRSIRGPSLQVAEEEWVDAAKSYGQSPLMTMRKHMAPYIASYIMIYASLLLGGIIIATAALSFLGLGINPPTPEWGRIVSSGRSYVSTSSWHISTLPGIMIVLVVTGFNALGDGIRDAIDPESDISGGDAAATGGGG
ncbi:ABC transporter permease [Natronomonas amylolytica]|uniref:ABC transporter permease n=1 Tax=Natronomonas amylolytica TaxID=3108498 RepID=UPI00300B4414